MKRAALILIALIGVLFGAASARAQSFRTLLDRPEQQAMAQTINYALEYNKTNQPAAWMNPATGNSGSLVPLKTTRDPEGQPCREFVATLIVDNIEWQGEGTACRQPDGQWLIVPGDSVDYRPLTRNDYAYYPYGSVDWYDSYPYYLWGSYPSVYFSYNVGYFSSHRHVRGALIRPGFGRERERWMFRGRHYPQRLGRHARGGVHNPRHKLVRDHRKPHELHRSAGKSLIRGRSLRHEVPHRHGTATLRGGRTHGRDSTLGSLRRQHPDRRPRVRAYGHRPQSRGLTHLRQRVRATVPGPRAERQPSRRDERVNRGVGFGGWHRRGRR